MAEISSSGEESGEEEEHDEATPSLSGPITAASSHTKRMKLRYFRGCGYLQRLPEHQQRRIQEEIEKGYKPGEMDCYVDSKLF